jgi:hypothetical protein
MSEKHICCEQIWGDYTHHSCGRGAKYEHEDKWYCGTHYPPNVAKRQDAARARWDAEAAERQRQCDVAQRQARLAELGREAIGLLGKAVLQHKAGFDNYLAETLREAEPLLAEVAKLEATDVR